MSGNDGTVAADQDMILSQPTGGGGGGGTGGGGGGWDLVQFLENGTDYVTLAGGALLGLVGIGCIIWSGVIAAKKLTSEQSRESWIKVAGLVVLGGVLAFGGVAMLTSLAQGGQESFENFGVSMGAHGVVEYVDASEVDIYDYGVS